MGRGTLSEVRDGSGDPRGGLGQVWIPSSVFGRVGGNGVARDMSGDPQGGPGQVLGTLGRSGTG